LQVIVYKAHNNSYSGSYTPKVLSLDPSDYEDAFLRKTASVVGIYKKVVFPALPGQLCYNTLHNRFTLAPLLVTLKRAKSVICCILPISGCLEFLLITPRYGKNY
jgi:hypothetical protein